MTLLNVGSKVKVFNSTLEGINIKWIIGKRNIPDGSTGIIVEDGYARRIGEYYIVLDREEYRNVGSRLGGWYWNPKNTKPLHMNKYKIL